MYPPILNACVLSFPSFLPHQFALQLICFAVGSAKLDLWDLSLWNTYAILLKYPRKVSCSKTILTKNN